ncbi:MAG: hypothetical protein ACN2B6_05060 [Rickettsiales bacterium]
MVAPTESKLLKPGLIVASIVLILVLQAGFIFILIALLPSIVAYFIDSSPHKSEFRVVFICNATATLPSLNPIVNAAIQMKPMDILPTVTDPTTWLIIYSGAAAGWCLIYLCRFIARFLITLYFEYKVNSLERFQEKLVNEWGDQIKGSKKD